MFVKSGERLEARRLRGEQGLPIKAIAKRVGVSVSSVSLWVRDIALTPAQQAVLRDLNPRYDAQLNGQARRSASALQARTAAQEHGRACAREGDPLHQAGCLLYWAEGSKSRNAAELANSDPALLRLYTRFLRESYDVALEQIVLTGHFHLGNGLGVDEIHDYWLTTLKLPQTSLRKPTIVASSTDVLKRRRLPYGTVSVTVFSTFIVQSIYGGIQEYGGFDRPEWLD
jgi:transcriptional regulator with XRE-family HTH domain